MKKLDKKKSKITLVELSPTERGILNGNPTGDVYSYVKLPPRALPSLQGLLISNGWENTRSLTTMYHGRNKRLSSSNLQQILESDALLISHITRTFPQSMKLADFYKKSNPEGVAIAGGFDATFRVKDNLDHVDVIVRKEGEKTLIELMERLAHDSENLEDIDGLAFKNKEGRMIVTPDRELLSKDELSSLPVPFYDSALRRGVKINAIETSRGCPHSCNFCTVTQFYGRRYRFKDVASVIEILSRTRDIGKTYFFADDNFAANPKHSKRLLEEIIRNNLDKKNSTAQVTVSVEKDKELLGLLKRAGITTLCIGIESVDDSSLQNLGKPYSAEQNESAVKKLRESGFWVHGMMMPGTDEDTPESLKYMSEWAVKNLDSAQFLPPTPLPGSRLYDERDREGRIVSKDWSLYDAQHVLVKPQRFSAEGLQETVLNMYRDFYSPLNSMRRIRNSSNTRKAFWHFIYANLCKGIKRAIIETDQMKEHMAFLSGVGPQQPTD